MLQNKISKGQFVKNLVVSGSGLVGGTIGAALGAMVGSGGGIGGALAAGAALAWASKKVADKISKDDSENMYQLIKIALIRLSHDYMIQSDEEFQRCIDYISSEKAIDTNLIRIMYSIGCDDDNDFLRVQVAYERLEYYFNAIVRQRKTVRLKNHQQMLLNAINDLSQEFNSENEPS